MLSKTDKLRAWIRTLGVFVEIFLYTYKKKNPNRRMGKDGRMSCSSEPR